MDEKELSNLINKHFPDMSNGYPYCLACRKQCDTQREWSDHMARVIEKSTINWPAMLYIYGTWAYALDRAREVVTRQNRKMYLYQGVVNGELVWIVSWDPKKPTRVIHEARLHSISLVAENPDPKHGVYPIEVKQF